MPDPFFRDRVVTTAESWELWMGPTISLVAPYGLPTSIRAPIYASTVLRMRRDPRTRFGADYRGQSAGMKAPPPAKNAAGVECRVGRSRRPARQVPDSSECEPVSAPSGVRPIIGVAVFEETSGLSLVSQSVDPISSIHLVVVRW